MARRSLVLALALALALVTAGCLSAEASGALEFDLASTDGERLRSEDFLGRVVVLDLMATWCSPCKEAMPHLREFHAANPDVVLLSVDVDTSPSEVRDDPLPGFKERFNASWPFAYDTDDVFRKAGARGIPTLVVVDKAGVVRELVTDYPLTVAEIEARVAPLVDEEPVPAARGVDVPVVAASFALGMAAVFSPCGFPMLPAYVAYYLDAETAAGRAARGPWRGALRGLGGGALAGLGAFAVLAAIGGLAAALGTPFKERVLLLELVGGLVVLALGVLTLAGKDFSFQPRVGSARGRGVLSLAAFGALYAAVAAGCVAPIFLGVVFQAFAAPTALEGFLYVAAYAAGLGVLLMGLTVAVAVAGQALVSRLNAVLPVVKKAGGAVMVLVGLYLIWYWARIEFFLA